MTKHSAHPQSIRCGYCWVCGAKFAGAGGTALQEVHHIIPVAYGGRDGPTVDLCENHHGGLHKAALAIRGGRGYRHIIPDLEGEPLKKLLWLATRVNEAYYATLGDPNKKAEVILPLDKELLEQITQLQKIYPRHRSRAAVIKLAIQQLHGKHFLRQV